MTDAFNVSGKTAMVTGASHGLGVTFAGALAAAGANVVVAARSAEKLAAVARSIRDRGGAVLEAPCDVGDAAAVARAVDTAWSCFGRVDILVNNAGVAAEAGIVPEKIPDALFEQTLHTNLTGLWFCSREVASRMLADGKGGSIINVASVMGLGGAANLAAAYQASKAGVINLTRALACSWGDRGVRVNALAPGWFPSEMTASIFRIPGFLEWAGGLAALRRVGRPEELIGPLLFLASDASSFVTGQTLAVDGGISAGVGAPALPASVSDRLAQAVPGGLGVRITSGDR